MIKEVLDTMVDLAGTGMTMVCVTHEMSFARKVADRVVFLFEGRSIYFGPVADLDKSDHPHIQEFLAMDRV